MQYETPSRRKPAASFRTLARNPALFSMFCCVASDSCVSHCVFGCGVPDESKYPTPPPWRCTQSGFAADAEDPTLVAMVNVWNPLMLHG